MKCELCHSNEVCRVIQKVVDGSEQDVFVCSRCALEECSGFSAAEPINRLSADRASSKVPNVNVFMDATINIAGIASGKCCPECGFTVQGSSSYKNLGCPECYKTFGKEIVERNLAAGYSGKRPHPVNDGIEIVSLKSQIEDAMRENRSDDVFRLKLALEDAESRGNRLRRSEGEQ